MFGVFGRARDVAGWRGVVAAFGVLTGVKVALVGMASRTALDVLPLVLVGAAGIFFWLAVRGSGSESA